MLNSKIIFDERHNNLVMVGYIIAKPILIQAHLSLMYQYTKNIFLPLWTIRLATSLCRVFAKFFAIHL